MSELRARIAAALAVTKAKQAANLDQGAAGAQQASSASRPTLTVPGMGSIHMEGLQQHAQHPGATVFLRPAAGALPSPIAVAPQPCPAMAFAPSAFLAVGREVPKSDLSGLLDMAALPCLPGSKTEDICAQYAHLVGPGQNFHNPRTKIEPVCQGDIVRFMVDTNNKDCAPRGRHVAILQDGQDIDQVAEKGFFIGVVRSFFPEKGWGFIGSREAALMYKSDIFIHRNESFKKTAEELGSQTEEQVNAERTPKCPAQEGDIVTFKIGFDPQGKIRAEQVTVVDPEVDEIQDGFFVGAVKFFREDSGWGFIASEGVMATFGVDEVFVHRDLFRVAAPGSKRPKTLAEPCFAGDLVKFTMHIEQDRGKCKAEHVSVIEPDAEVPDGFFSGMIKSFYPDTGYGFITSSQLLEVHGMENVLVHRDNFPGGASETQALPVPGRFRTREEPCFIGDPVQFTVSRDGAKEKIKADNVTVIQEGTPIADGFFVGIVKIFFGTKGWGFIESPVVLHEYGTEDVFVHRDCFSVFVAEQNLQRPIGTSGRTRMEPCFAADVVQFAVTTDTMGKLKAEQLSIVDDDTDIAEDLFTGTVKTFFPEKGWGFITSQGVLEVHGCEDVFFHRDEFFNVSDEQKIQAMTDGVQRIQAMVEKYNGRIPIRCDLGFKCPKPICGKIHPPEGREILENPELLLCRYKYKCKNAECFYIHLEGREIDNNPEKGMCKYRGECTNPKCMFLHPAGTDPNRGLDRAGRERRGERDKGNMRCNQCGELGHLAKTCLQSQCHNCGGYGHMASACYESLAGRADGGHGGGQGANRRRASVVVRDLPVAWADLSDDEFKEHISWDLSVFGPLVDHSIGLSSGRLEAYAQFQNPEHAQAAVGQLNGGDGDLHVELRCSHEASEECAIVHIDELRLPMDAEEAFPLDCEVWVDSAEDLDLEDWHDLFGPVDEIFHVPGSPVAGFPASGAYVRFSLHESAAKAVYQGRARWSSSERALSNNRGSICNALLAHSGEPIRKMRDELGLRVLHLGGSGRAGSGIFLRRERREMDCMSSRLHFVARGGRDKLQDLRGFLERRLATMIVDRRPKKRTYITEPVVVNPKKPRKAPFMPSAAALAGNTEPPGAW